VYILDVTSMVEVRNVTNCQIFIGPVDGAAIFENVTGSRIAVAAQQFQGKAVTNTSFDMYVATRPTLHGCSNVKIGCWRGSYPGLSSHFAEAHLDPNSNHWQEAKDISSGDGDAETFELVNTAQPWEVPVLEDSAFAEADNPVPFNPSGNGTFASPSLSSVQNGHQQDFAEPEGEHPQLRAINAKLRERQEAQESREKEVKADLVNKASTYLEDFYKNRSQRIEQRSKRNKETEQGLTVAGLEGNTHWEKTVNLVNFNFTRPNGTDLTRFKNVLFSAKSKNVPITSKTAV
jgi:protein XRP2